MKIPGYKQAASMKSARTPFFFAILLFCGCLGLALFPVFFQTEPTEINPDEGLYATHAALLRDGYQLYSQIWSDQPPVVPTLVRLSFQLFGNSIWSGRLPVALCSALLLLSLFLVVSRGKRWLGGSFAVASLLASPMFQNCSAAVMVGTPAVALGGCSAALLVGYRYSKAHRTVYLLASAALLAVSVLAKLFTIILLPAVLWATFSKTGRSAQSTSRDFSLWCATFVCTLFLLVAFFAPSLLHGDLNQLIIPHLVTENEVTRKTGFGVILSSLRAELPRTLLACMGFVFVWLGILPARRELFIPTIWLLCAIAATFFHRPLWPHHYLLVAVPLSWVSALIFLEGWRFLRRFAALQPGTRRWRENIPSVSLIFCFSVWSIGALPFDIAREFQSAQSTRDAGRLNSYVLTVMSNFASKTHWVVTDRPIYALAINRPVPPFLSLFSNKRKLGGLISADDVRAMIVQYTPEQILLMRFPDLHEELADELSGGYRVLWTDRSRALYVRGDLVPTFERDIKRYVEICEEVFRRVELLPKQVTILYSGESRMAEEML